MRSNQEIIFTLTELFSPTPIMVAPLSLPFPLFRIMLSSSFFSCLLQRIKEKKNVEIFLHCDCALISFSGFVLFYICILFHRFVCLIAPDLLLMYWLADKLLQVLVFKTNQHLVKYGITQSPRIKEAVLHRISLLASWLNCLLFGSFLSDLSMHSLVNAKW